MDVSKLMESLGLKSDKLEDEHVYIVWIISKERWVRTIKGDTVFETKSEALSVKTVNEKKSGECIVFKFRLVGV